MVKSPSYLFVHTTSMISLDPIHRPGEEQFLNNERWESQPLDTWLRYQLPPPTLSTKVFFFFFFCDYIVYCQTGQRKFPIQFNHTHILLSPSFASLTRFIYLQFISPVINNIGHVINKIGTLSIVQREAIQISFFIQYLYFNRKLNFWTNVNTASVDRLSHSHY